MTPADLYARAVVASAYVYGDDPIEALISDVSQRRRSLGAAAFAVAQDTGRSRSIACRTLNITRDTATRAMRTQPVRFGRAMCAALAALANPTRKAS